MSGDVNEREEALARARALIQDFLLALERVRRMSPNTVRAYETDLEGWVSFCEREGEDPLALTRNAVRRYLAEMVRAAYADRTVNRRLSSLRTFCAWLEREGHVDATQATSVSGRKLSKTLPRAISAADAAHLIDSVECDTAEGLRDHALLEFLYASGARISEVAALRPSDIRTDEGCVRLFGKGSKERIVPLYPEALKIMARYLKEARPVLAARAKKGAPKTVFVSTRGNEMSAAALRERFERRVAEAGLEGHITPHAMRHTFGTELLGGGADLRSVQELLGHESLATTQIYTHLSIERLKDATKQAHPRG